MGSGIASFPETLKQTRLRKKWTQRDLGERVNLTAAGISDFERDARDLRLSAAVELSRALDHDLVLVPRHALLAVRAVVREADRVQEARQVRGAVNLFVDTVRTLQARSPRDELVAELVNETAKLHSLDLSNLSETVRSHLLATLAEIESISLSEKPGRSRLSSAVSRLTGLRKEIAAIPSREERPAYRLDDD